MNSNNAVQWHKNIYMPICASFTHVCLCPSTYVHMSNMFTHAHSISLMHAQVHNAGAGRQAVDLATMLRDPLLALASEIEHGQVTMMLVPRAALVQDCEAEAPLRVWGAIADKQVCFLRPLCPATVVSWTSNSHDTIIQAKFGRVCMVVRTAASQMSPMQRKHCCRFKCSK